jgi:hypothetical protein
MIHASVEQVARMITNTTEIPLPLRKALEAYSVGWYRVGSGVPPSYETDVLMLAVMTNSIELKERSESFWDGIPAGKEVQVFDSRGIPDYEGVFIQRASLDGQIVVEQKHVPGSRHRVLEDRVRLLGVSIVEPQQVPIESLPGVEPAEERAAEVEPERVPRSETEPVGVEEVPRAAEDDDEEAKQIAAALAIESREAKKRFRDADKKTKVEFFDESGAVESGTFRGIEDDHILVKVLGTRVPVRLQHRNVIMDKELEAVG